MIEHEFVRTWGWLLALVTNGLLLWAGWTLCKKFVTREDFTAHLAAEESHKAATRDHLAEHDIAVNALTDKINAMPGKDAIHVLDVKLVSIQGELTAQTRLCAAYATLCTASRINPNCCTETAWRERDNERHRKCHYQKPPPGHPPFFGRGRGLQPQHQCIGSRLWPRLVTVCRAMLSRLMPHGWTSKNLPQLTVLRTCPSRCSASPRAGWM